MKHPLISDNSFDRYFLLNYQLCIRFRNWYKIKDQGLQSVLIRHLVCASKKLDYALWPHNHIINITVYHELCSIIYSRNMLWYHSLQSKLATSFRPTWIRVFIFRHQWNSFWYRNIKQSQNAKAVRRFLKLTDYFRKFINDYGRSAKH